MKLFLFSCCKKAPEKTDIELQAYPTATPIESKKLRLLEIFEGQHAVENAMFLCEYRDILIEQEHIKPETLRAQAITLFDRYILKEQPIELTVNGQNFSTTTPTINISAPLKARTKNVPTQESAIFALLGDIYKEIMDMVIPRLKDNQALDILEIFKTPTTSAKKKTPLAAVSKSSRGHMVSHVVESPSQRGKQAEKDDDGHTITYARP